MEEVLLWLDGMQRQPLGVVWPHIFIGLRIAANAKSVRCLNENVAFVPDALDDVAEDLDVAGRPLVSAAGVDVDHRSAGLVALVRGVGDFGGRNRDFGAVAILLCAAVDRGQYDKLLCGRQSDLP